MNRIEAYLDEDFKTYFAIIIDFSSQKIFTTIIYILQFAVVEYIGRV